MKVPDAKLPPLKNIKEKRELQQFFGKLQTKGYGPIYEVNVLAHISNKPEVIEVINEVIEAIKSLRPEHISHDIAGVFFHKLVPFEIRKVLATYYTVPNAADLLAGLAIRGAHQSVLDPACGSGTLLVASYKRKEHLWTKYEGGYTSEKMHKQFLEKDITGNDLMPFAGHLATMNLAMQNIEQPTKNVRIGSGDSLSLAYQFADPNFKKGITQGKFTTHQTTSMDEFLASNKKAKRSTKSAAGSLSTEFKLTPCDLVIMNPPFSDIEKIIKVSPEMITKLKENRILSDK